MNETTHTDAAADRLAAIESTFVQLAHKAPAGAGWRPPWDELAREGVATATPERRLTAWVALRGAAGLPPAAGLYLIAQEVERLAWQRVEAEVAGLREEIAAARVRWDIEEWGGEVLRPLPGADGFAARYPLDWAKRYYTALMRHAGADLADQFRTDPVQFAANYQTGRAYFDPPSAGDKIPAWVRRLIDRIGRSRGLVPEWAGAVLHTVRVSLSENRSEVVLAYRPVPKRRPGRITEIHPAPYVMDVIKVTRAFDAVDETRWIPFGSLAHPDAPFVCLTGTAEGNRVQVRVLAGWLPGPEDLC